MKNESKLKKKKHVQQYKTKIISPKTIPSFEKDKYKRSTLSIILSYNKKDSFQPRNIEEESLHSRALHHKDSIPTLELTRRFHDHEHNTFHHHPIIK